MGSLPHGSSESRHLETSADPIQILRDVVRSVPWGRTPIPYGSEMANFFPIRGMVNGALLDRVRYGVEEARQALAVARCV